MLDDDLNELDESEKEEVQARVVAHRAKIRSQYVGHDELSQRELHLIRLLGEIEQRLESSDLSAEDHAKIDAYRLEYAGQLSTVRTHLQRLDAIRDALILTGEQADKELLVELDEQIERAYRLSISGPRKNRLGSAAKCVELQAQRGAVLRRLIFEE